MQHGLPTFTAGMLYEEVMTDRKLLQAISQKDNVSFNIFYMKYAAILLRWIRRYTRDVMLSEDITQNFWMKIWLEPEKIMVDENDSARNFLSQHFAFYVMECIKANRLRTNSQSLDEIEGEFSYTHVEEDCSAVLLNQVIGEALKELSPESGKLFDLVCRQDYPISKAAKELDINERTVRYKLKQCIMAIQQNLEDKEDCVTSSDPLKNTSYLLLLLLFSSF